MAVRHLLPGTNIGQRVGTRDSADQLLALAAVAEGRSQVEAAEIGGLDRQTLRDWVHRFNGEGPEGLLDR